MGCTSLWLWYLSNTRIGECDRCWWKFWNNMTHEFLIFHSRQNEQDAPIGKKGSCTRVKMAKQQQSFLRLSSYHRFVEVSSLLHPLLPPTRTTITSSWAEIEPILLTVPLLSVRKATWLLLRTSHPIVSSHRMKASVNAEREVCQCEDPTPTSNTVVLLLVTGTGSISTIALARFKEQQ